MTPRLISVLCSDLVLVSYFAATSTAADMRQCDGPLRSRLDLAAMDTIIWKPMYS